jgi:hypothetical protein
MNTYDKLKFHLTRHAYKRGQYKGDAPFDQSRRSRSHHRVVERSQFMVIRFHNTDIVRAYPDGRVMIDCNGWASHSTTMTAVREATKFMPFHFSVSSRSVMSLSQMVLRTQDSMVKYYDGITLDGAGNVITPLRPFEARRIDKAESEEFMDGLHASGFKDMFRVLYATVQPPEATPYYPRILSDSLTDPEHAADWPHIIAKYKYEHKWQYGASSGMNRGWVEVGNAQTCWSRIMAVCKKDMYNNVTTEVVSIK